MIRRRFLSLFTAFAGSSGISFFPGSAAHSAEPLPPCGNLNKNLGSWSVYSDASIYVLNNSGKISYASPFISQEIQPETKAKNVIQFFNKPGDFIRFSFGAGEDGNKQDGLKSISRLIFEKIRYANGKNKNENVEIAARLSLDKSYITEFTTLHLMPSKGLYAEFTNYQKNFDLHKMFSAAKTYKIEYMYQGNLIMTVEGACDGFSKAMELAQKSQKSISDKARAKQCNPEGCIMTTMACNTIGLPDDCFELRMMRRLRDVYVKKQENGECVISNYYKIAPMLREFAKEQEESSYMARIYLGYVLPGSILSYVGLYHISYKLMLRMVRKMEKKYLKAENHLFQ